MFTRSYFRKIKNTFNFTHLTILMRMNTSWNQKYAVTETRKLFPRATPSTQACSSFPRLHSEFSSFQIYFLRFRPADAFIDTERFCHLIGSATTRRLTWARVEFGGGDGVILIYFMKSV